MVQEINDISEIPTSGKVVIDFYATWCGPCKRVAPVFVELSGYFKSISFLKCNVDESEEVSEKYSVESLPTFVFLHNGVVHKRIEGGNIDAVLEALKELEKL